MPDGPNQNPNIAYPYGNVFPIMPFDLPRDPNPPEAGGVPTFDHRLATGTPASQHGMAARMAVQASLPPNPVAARRLQM